ncbi:ABC transporter permease [Parapedobacter koreensis]|uniref:ABC-type antimicrobial peptide transport system, permease component n=1 Tax=Parapedobacter koreensis TaxID=332977 RepID=A0A1H7R0G3_9SPHI|nr:FtsX-like permease family protein [Parapedobacter koreensis]SEL53632.1 ABC-type antimicrobial peptide transport system, permease component [Parapedobacter koreensis]
MIGSYLKTTLRHLWRNRLFTALNILGLSIGLCASFVVYRLVTYELSYDQGLPNLNDYVQLAVKQRSHSQESGVTAVAMGLAPIIENEVTGVEAIIPMYYRDYGKSDAFKDQVAVLPSYFDMVPYRWLAGSPATALRGPHDVVLTQSRAEYHYPGLQPSELMGKTITYRDTITMTISGVVENLAGNTSFDAQEFFRITESEWPSDLEFGWRNNCLLFLKLHPGTSQANVLSQINAINTKRNADYFERFQSSYSYTFIPVAERHFVSDYYSPHHRTANKNVLYGLAGIAAFLLLLAIINYVNLSTAILPQRTREIGIRKTLGSRSRQLVLRFMGETLCITFLALLLAFLLHGLIIRLFADYFPDGLSGYYDYSGIALFLTALILVITGLSSIYPSWLLTKVNTVKMMKGQVDHRQQGGGLVFRRMLIVFQFVIAQIFIIGALIVGLQLRYTLHKDLGFNKDAIITLDITDTRQKNDMALSRQQVLQQALLKHPEVAGVSIGEIPLGAGVFSHPVEYNGPSGIIRADLLVKNIDENWMNLYEVKLLAGRQPFAGQQSSEIMLNETAVKAFGFGSAEEALGKLIGEAEDEQVIVGVVGDFHVFNFKMENRPLQIRMGIPENASTITIKLHASASKRWASTIERFADDWKAIYPETPFAYRFYDEVIERMYTQEHRMAKIINYTTGVAIFISCLGLFGLATLMAYQRTKEIGIRKVLGASISNILALFSKEFVMLVVIAVVIASPIAWWATSKWLEDYAYRIDIQWWMFAVAGLGAVTLALLTVSGQAIRAAVANPVNSLRDE